MSSLLTMRKREPFCYMWQWLSGKEFVYQGDARGAGLILGLGRYPGVENGNPLQYSCMENSIDRRALWATVHGVTKSWTWLSTHTHIISLKVKAPLLLPHFSMWRDFNQSRDSYILWQGWGWGSLRKSGKAYGPLHRIMFLNVYNMIFRGMKEINYS